MAATSIRGPDDGQTIAFTQHFTSGPPSALVLKDDGEFDTMAIEKQEEWIKKRKVEQVTTKQIETRVKRQVVVNEDGQVLDDSGPQVTTRTTEDTETKREEHTEKTGGDGDGTVATLPPEGWVAIPGAVIVREKHEKKSNTRDEIDERLETEEVHHLGHLTNQELEEALEKQRETGQALTWRRRQSSVSGGSSGSESAERQLVAPYSTGKRVVHQSRKHKRIIDQENTEERSEEKDGRITTETKRHEHHEEIDDNEEPEDDRPASDTSSIHEVVKETRNNYTTLQDEDQVEYIAVPKGGHISGGVKLGHGPRQTTQKTVQYDGQGDVVDGARNGPCLAPEPQATTPVVAAHQPTSKLPAQAPVIPPQETAEQTAERTDALTKKPLDLEAEEETRKLETSRWLDSHFGSESSTDGGSANGSKIGLSGSKSGKKNKEKSKMPSQVSSGGINVTMKSDPSGSDRYDPLANEPMVTNSRIYSSTTGLNSFNRTTQQQQQQTQQRIQSGPQSPSYNKLSTSPGYQTNLNNGKPELYRNLSAGDQEPIKRASSFNHSAGRATGIYSWMNKEELKGHQSNPLAARQSFLQSMNRTIPDKYQSPVQQSSSPPTYAAPVSQTRRWPPPVKPIDDGPEDDMRTSTPVYQAPHQHQATPNRSGGTIIRLGPTVDYSTTNGRKPSNSGISRTQSLLTPSGSKQPFQDSSTPDRVYSSPVGNNIMNQQYNTTSRMNLLNSSLQSVPEREQRSSHYSPQPQGYFVDTERSFQSPNRSSGNPKVIQSYAIKTPPPRPAPPTTNHYGSPSSMYPTSGSNNKLRMSESFRSPKSPPMFAVEELASPPVRPVRRKQSKRINPATVKTDSGTQCNPQTIRNDMIQQQQQYHSQTLDRSSSKPMKKYYMGEDPFTPSKGVVNGKVELEMSQPSKPARSEVTRSQTLPRRPSKQPLLSETSIHLNNSANISNNTSSSRVFSDQDRSLNETFPAEIGGLNQSGSNRPASSRIVAITPVKNIQNNNNNTPMSSNKNNSSSSSVTNLSSSTLAVNRSQSFQVGPNQSTTTPAAPAASLQQRRSSLLSSTPLRSVSIRSSNLNSPLYKSTSFLNRTSGAELSHQPFASLKSPGIVTSISKSQLDLNKSTTELNSFQPPPPQPYSNSALYTLPRRRSNAQPATNAASASPKVPEPDAEWVRQPVDILAQPLQLAQTSSKVQTGISDRLAQLSSSPPKSPTIDDSPGSRGESYSSLHRRKMQAAAAAAATPSPATPPPPPPPPQPTESQPMSFQSSTKSTHRSFRGVTNETIKEENEKAHEQPQTREQQPEPELEPEARSLKDRIALLENAGIHYANPAQTLPRVVGGKTKAPPPPPAKTYHSPVYQQQEPKPERMVMKEESPEVESIEKRQKFLEGLLNSAPELFMHIHGDENLKDIRVNREDVIDGKSPDARLPRTPSPPTHTQLGGFNNRVYTSTPVTGPAKMINHPIPLTPPPLLIRNNSGGSPFGSQRDLLAPLRRGSLTLSNTGSIGSNGGVIIPAVKIPAPVNYSETVRIKSNQDPDSQSDSVQSYSKRVQPFVDGFSSETKSSSQQTTMSRSEYTTADRPSDSTSDIPRLSPSIYHSIRPQQSGGVIITVRGNGGQ